jgi:energy-coupling factor transporter ATP-binding protein EcfA2
MADQMQLSFSQPHISIRAFPTIEVPPLTVIVGINGSGKSHLLQALQHGLILNSITPPNDPVTALPNVVLMAPNIHQANVLPSPSYQSPTGPEYDFSDDQFSPDFERLRTHVLQPTRAQMINLYGGIATEVEREDFWQLGAKVFAERFPTDNANNSISLDLIQNVFSEAEKRLISIPPEAYDLRGQLNFEAALALLRQVGPVARKLKISPLCVEFAHFRKFRNWGEYDVFNTDIARWFGKYRDRYLQHQLKQLGEFKQGNREKFEDGSFLDTFGPAPWAKMNETLADFGLPFEFSCPELSAYEPITPILKKISTGDPVGIEYLSSGQKVLFKFAVSTFQFDEAVMNVRRPKLVLLDEMDASLHPEMVRRWLSAVSTGLVERQNIACILTTHSPTTVALAPEESLFEMIDGEQGLKKVGKQYALNRLTVGVPTLSIDFSGRRQVFVESDTDVPIYEKLFALLKPEIGLQRHLHFMSTGLRKQNGGEINSGCTMVRKLVNGLSEQGNQSTFGIVDWDGKATSTSRVLVLAEGRKDGIENVVLDPLLVALLLIKRLQHPDGVEKQVTFVGAASMSDTELQSLADAIQNPLKSQLPECSTTLETEFLNGRKISVLESYNRANDHDLEAALLTTFQSLKTWSGKGKLAEAIVDEVLSEFPGLCPVEMKDVFQRIATAES